MRSAPPAAPPAGSPAAAPAAARPTPGPGASPAAPKRRITADDLWAIDRVGSPAALPDGSGVVVPVTTVDRAANEGRTRLWLLPIAPGAESRPLTAPGLSASEPAVSPDGRFLAFSRRVGKEKPQLYLMPLDGGEPEKLTDLPLGASDPRFFSDGRRLAFIAPVLTASPTPDGTRQLAEEREKDPVKARATEDRFYRYWDHWLTSGEVHHVFVLDLATRRLTDLTPDSRRFFDPMDPSGSYDIAPDGSEIVFAANATEPPYEDVKSDVFTVPVAGGPVKNVTPENTGDSMRPRYTPDGSAIVYGMQREVDFYADKVRLVRLDRKTGRSAALTESWDRSATSWEIAPDSRSVAFLAEDEGRVGLYRLDLDQALAAAERGPGLTPELLTRGGHLGSPAWVGERRLVFQRDDLSGPPEIWTLAPNATTPVALSHFNDARMAGFDLGAVEEITFPGAGGHPIQMFVVTPPGFDPKKKWPLVHLVHGGPHGIFGDQFHFRWNAQLFASKGYVVAMVNFHGSTSFGQEFAASILGSHGDQPFDDMMAATDRMLATGYIDEQKMAAAGGSYGGYLVSWIAGHTDRFACLINHAGVYDTLAQYASDVTYGRSRAYGGEPWGDLAAIDRWNPARFAAGFKTPMLVIHGECDYRVPYTQGLSVYGVLKAKGVPARLVVYPDENHWILKAANSCHWYSEVLGWLERFLGAESAGKA
jgi:dipeptidyl aminopeptidase/acylaminoacyl peptidase